MCVCTSHLGTESEFLVCLCVVNFVQIYLMWTLNNRKHDRKRKSNSQTEMPLAHSFQTNKHFNNFVWCRFSDLKDRIVLMWNRSFNHFKVTANHRRIDQYLRQLICIWFRFVYFILSNRVSGEGGGSKDSVVVISSTRLMKKCGKHSHEIATRAWNESLYTRIYSVCIYIGVVCSTTLARIHVFISCASMER